MDDAPRPDFRRYGVALVVCLVGLVFKLALRPALAGSPFLLAYAAVMVSAWYGGFGPGLLATLLTAVTSDLFFAAPIGRFALSGGDLFRLTLYVLEGLLISALSSRMLSAQRRAQAARAAAEHAADRIARLQSITAALSEAVTSEQIADVILRETVRGLDADAASVSVPNDAGDTLRIIRSVGYADALIAQWREFPLGDRTPIGDAIRDGQPVSFETRAARLAAYPGLERPPNSGPEGAVAAIPLVVHGRTMGAIGVSFRHERTFSAEDRAFMTTMAYHCAQALERARFEEEERLVGQRLVGVLERMGDAFLAIDHDWRILYANRGAELLTRQSRDALVGHLVFEAFPRVDDLPFFAEMQRALDTQVATTVEGYYPPLDLWFESRIFPNDGGIATFTRDVSERRRIDEERRAINQELERRVEDRTQDLETANREMEEANRELEAFSYSVSHDLRAPLRALDGFSRILLEDHSTGLDAEAQRYLGMVRENAQRMGALIDSLLAFSRLGRQPLHKQRLDPGAMARAALEDLQDERKDRTIEVVIAELPACEADPALLKQVFVNLLSNALKYTRRRAVAHVEVGSLREGDETVYFVRDDGAGFDMRYANKLFGVFQRLHGPQEFEGVGVGLALAHRIVQRHGGRMWADAKVDGGATFFFSLDRPRGAQPSEPDVAAASPGADAAATGSRRG